MHLLRVLSLFAGFTAALPTEEPVDGKGPSSDEIQVVSIAYAGSGCPAGSMTGPFSSNVITVSLLPHPTLVAQSGKNISIINHRTNCQTVLKIRYPSGWQFSISEIAYKGYAKIPAGSSGESKVIYYFSGQTVQVCIHPSVLCRPSEC